MHTLIVEIRGAVYWIVCYTTMPLGGTNIRLSNTVTTQWGDESHTTGFGLMSDYIEYCDNLTLSVDF